MTDQVNPEGGALPSDSPGAEPTPETAQVAESPPAADTSAPKEPKGVGKRIDELTRLRRDAERERDHWREMAMRGTAPKVEERPQPEAPKSLKDFGYDEKAYRDHLYVESRKAAEEAAKEAGLKWKAEQEAISRRAKFDERVSKFAETVEDYSEVVTESTPVSEAMADAIMDSDEAGALMYYLGQNPDVATKLYHLSAAKAGREIQKIEDRLIAERKKAAEKPVTNAPPPAPTIDGKGAVPAAVKVDSVESDTLSDAEWTRRRNAQEAARLRKARDG